MAIVTETEKSSAQYVIVNNIPSCYHSSDLRNFFSHFLETEGFECFHFRHRPEVQKPKSASGHAAENDACETETATRIVTRSQTCCCVVRVKKDRVNELIKSYHKKHWIDKKGETLPYRCFISRIDLNSADSHSSGSETRDSTSNDRSFTATDLKNLLEMHPPLAMPNGNVGTPTKVFLELIRTCRLPPMIIKKLQLEFPRNRCARLYSSVPYHYGGKPHAASQLADTQDELIRTAKGDILSENDVSDLQKSQQKMKTEGNMSEDNAKEATDDDDDDDDMCEEWERHEALHNDVTQQERIKERLFEEKIELKWEKGGSGLVFYTDAQYWDAKEGDFDEKTADDWDVDTSIYYQSGYGDKDSQDLLQMRIEKRLHDGMDEEDYSRIKIGKFECHTKGIGRKVLEKHGWKEGEGLGRSVRGRAEPVDDAGQHPRDKRGLGFHGEKLQRHGFSNLRKRRPSTGPLISTVYDDPQITEPKEPLLRSSALTRLSYRKDFIKSSRL